jgi:hypothetical protein
VRASSVFLLQSILPPEVNNKKKRKEEGDSVEKRGEVYPTKALPS